MHPYKIPRGRGVHALTCYGENTWLGPITTQAHVKRVKIHHDQWATQHIQWATTSTRATVVSHFGKGWWEDGSRSDTDHSLEIYSAIQLHSTALPHCYHLNKDLAKHSHLTVLIMTRQTTRTLCGYMYLVTTFFFPNTILQFLVKFPFLLSVLS